MPYASQAHAVVRLRQKPVSLSCCQRLLKAKTGLYQRSFPLAYEEGAKYFDAQVAQAAGFDISASPEIDSVETALEAVDRLNERYARTVGSS